MKKALTAVFLLAAGGGIGYTIFMALASERRLAALAPATTTAWVEAHDLSGSLEQFKANPNFKDFEKSKSYAEMMKGWEQLVALDKEDQLPGWDALGLPLSQQTILRFLGKDVGLGLIAPAQGDPSAYLMARLDVMGLLKDVAVEGDWTKLWGKLQEAWGGPNATKDVYKSFEVITRPVQGTDVHFAMLEDVIVVSHSKDAIKAVVDVKVGEAPGLVTRDGYKQHVGALKAGSTAFAWVDMEFVRDKARVAGTLHRLAEKIGPEAEPLKQFKGDELDVLIEDMKPVTGLAIAAYVPQGDLYQAHLAASADTAALFKEAGSADLRQLASEETVLYLETRGTYDKMVGFARSEALEKVLDCEAGRWLRAKLENPAELGEMMGERSLKQLKEDPTFEARLALLAAHLIAQEVLGNDVALAIEAHDAESPMDAIRPLALVRARPLTRVVADLAIGAVVAHKDKLPPGFESAAHEGSTIYSVTDGPMGVHFARVQGDVVVSTRKDLVQRVIDRAKKGGEGTADARFKEAIGKLPADYTFFAYFGLHRFQHVAEQMIENGGVRGDEADMLRKVSEHLGKQMAAGAMGVYVSDDYTTLSVRGYQQFGSDETAKKLYRNADPQPAAWTVLPDETFASFAVEMDPNAIWDYGMMLAKMSLPEEDIKRAVEGFQKEVLGGKDIKTDLLAHLGQGFGLGVIRQERMLPEGLDAKQAARIIAPPAAVISIAAKDPAKLEATLLEVIGKATQGLNQAKARGQEAAAIGALKTINTSQVLFREGDKDYDGKLNYAASLKVLGEAYLIDDVLASGVKQGYRFELRASKTAPEDSWMAVASPMTPQAGASHFATDVTGVVYFSERAIELNDACTIPDHAKPLGSAPRPQVQVDPNDPSLLRFVEKEIAGVKARVLVMPENDRKSMERMVGKAVSPCLAAVNGHLVLASSEFALEQAIAAGKQNGTLAGSPAFQRAIAGQPTKVAAFGHINLGGIAAQYGANAEMIAREMAPAPADMKPPQWPEYPEMDWGGNQPSPDFSTMSREEQQAYWKKQEEEQKARDERNQRLMQEYEKLQQKYNEESQAHRTKLREWREAHAAENGKRLAEILASLSVLGDVITWSKLDDTGAGMESATIFKLDVQSAAATAEKPAEQKPAEQKPAEQKPAEQPEPAGKK